MFPPDEGRQVKRPGNYVSYVRKKGNGEYGVNDMNLSIIVEQSLCRIQHVRRHLCFYILIQDVEK